MKKELKLFPRIKAHFHYSTDWNQQTSIEQFIALSNIQGYYRSQDKPTSNSNTRITKLYRSLTKRKRISWQAKGDPYRYSGNAFQGWVQTRCSQIEIHSPSKSEVMKPCSNKLHAQTLVHFVENIMLHAIREHNNISDIS